ncbi:MAG: gliding motility-associated C-terminal domain-containing protein [Sphingobacteriales bacterium]|nr:gliding motility-associated C-terminal domain-containing protein [Sphingobacteriales bacterium]
MCHPETATSDSIAVSLSNVTYVKPVVAYCKNDSQTIDLLVIAAPDPDFDVKWTNGSVVTTNSNSVYTVNNLSNANIPFEITYGNNCKVTDFLRATVHSLPVINATSDIADAKYEQEVQLNANGSASLTFNWLPSDQVSNNSVQNPTAIIKATMLYNVTVRDTNDCVNSDTVLVRLIDECTEDFIYIPNAFSPNRDGVNDCFGIMSPPKLSNYKMSVFNRWGEKVFDAVDENDCWDGMFKGTPALSDAYVYVLSFICYNGKNLSKKGTVTIIK